jgi:hypothetical protein
MLAPATSLPSHSNVAAHGWSVSSVPAVSRTTSLLQAPPPFASEQRRAGRDAKGKGKGKRMARRLLLQRSTTCYELRTKPLSQTRKQRDEYSKLLQQLGRQRTSRTAIYLKRRTTVALRKKTTTTGKKNKKKRKMRHLMNRCSRIIHLSTYIF